MRPLFILLTFAIFSSASAQDYCKLIKKEVSPDKKILDYSTPPDAQEVPAVKISRSINLDPDYESDNFFMIFSLAGDLDNIYTKSPDGGQTEKEEYKLVVEFDDKSKIVDDTIKISHDFTGDKMQSIRYVYYTLTDPTIKDFTTKKITKFTLAGYEKTIPADSANAIMHYVQCIKAAK
jgi:hypothetical protein